MARPKKQHLKRRKDGRYRCMYAGIPFYGYTEDEALAAREAYKRQEAAGEYRRENPTVRDYADRWLKLHKASVSAKCYNDYKKQMDALTDIIGDIPVRDVTVDDAASVWSHYAGYSASTVKRAKMLYTSMFETAIENELCSRNPFKAKHAQPPKAPAGTHRALTGDEIDAIWATPHRMQLAALIMLYCGLRRGEALALTADDIDLDANTVTVSKAVRFDGNRPVLTQPKTAAGVRKVPVPFVLRPLLQDLTGRILSTVSGETMTETAFSACWASFIIHLSRTMGHPVDIRPHDLRHTYCTMLRDAGVDLKQAMIWMGHADEKMILRVYDHVSDQRTQISVEQMDKLLLKGQK